MKVYLTKDVEQVGMAGEIIKVNDGYARNFLFPRKLAVEITAENEQFFASRVKVIENRKEKIESKTSMLAQRISGIKLTLAEKMHDDGKLYGAVRPMVIVNKLAEHGISISENQVVFDEKIRSKGTYEVTIKLSSRLLPRVKVTVISE